MIITISIDTDNDAFQESMNGETARILEHLAKRMRRDEIDIHPNEFVYLQDDNGNGCGHLEVTR